jgi:hypothetical protein
MDRFEWDPRLTGFGKRVRDGRETWVIQYRLGHKQRRMTIGTCAKLTQAQARDQAKRRLAAVALGQDRQPTNGKAVAKPSTPCAASSLSISKPSKARSGRRPIAKSTAI